MIEQPKQKTKRYYAAANSYRGFISFFDKVFDSKNFDRVYILKGGPGTGKSSFMKKIAVALKDNECEIDEIYCSSDPKSLDGIIIKKEGRRIAIIDGTAPHERDAVIPGAIDEIINLGEGWDSRWLIAKRNKICELTEEKAKAYKCAYSYLKIAGVADEYIMNVCESNFDKSKANIKAERILEKIKPSENPKLTNRLVSSFGKYGYYRITVNDLAQEPNLEVCGDEYSSLLFLKTISETALSKGLSFIRFVNPLNVSYLDGLSFEDYRLTITQSENGAINSSEFMINDKMYFERTRHTKEMKNDALEESKRWFSIASELHFELENIYGEAMNFKFNDEIIDKKLSEIKNILQIQ